MVLQNGQAAPITAAPVATSSSARSTFTRLPFSSPRNTSPPPAPQQNDRSRVAGRIHHLTGPRDHLARLIVDVAIAAQVAGVVEDDLLARPGRGRQPRADGAPASSL